MSEQVSARLSDEGVKSGELRLCLNLSKDHVTKYGLVENKYVTVGSYGPTKYIVRFHPDKKNPKTQRWAVNVQKKNQQICGAVLQLEPRWCKITKDEKILGVILSVESLDDAFIFELDPNNFSPAPKEISVIRTPQDKTNAGFTNTSSWGETVQVDIEDTILSSIVDHMYRKYGGKRV